MGREGVTSWFWKMKLWHKAMGTHVAVFVLYLKNKIKRVVCQMNSSQIQWISCCLWKECYMVLQYVVSILVVITLYQSHLRLKSTQRPFVFINIDFCHLTSNERHSKWTLNGSYWLSPLILCFLRLVDHFYMMKYSSNYWDHMQHQNLAWVIWISENQCK